MLMTHLLSGVEQLGVLDELTELEQEDTRSVAVGEHDAEALVLVEHGLELTHMRRGLDDHLAGHVHRELDDCPEPLCAAREHRDAADV